jgi:hypothetical protein
VLKAFFDEEFTIPDPLEATADGSELESWRCEALARITPQLVSKRCDSDVSSILLFGVPIIPASNWAF